MHFEHFFRLGENFSVRGYGARFWAGPLQQLFKAYGKNPLRHLLRSRFGEQIKNTQKYLVQAFRRSTIVSSANSSLAKFLILPRGPGPKNFPRAEKVHRLIRK